MTDAPRRGPAKGPADPGANDTGLPASELAGVGLQFAASLLVFLFAGQWLDRRLGTSPWLMMIGVFVGAGASFYSMYRKLTAANERAEQRARERKAQREQEERDARGGSP